MSVNEGSIEPTLAEVLASIRRIAEFGDTPSLQTAPEFSHEDDADFVVPAFLRPTSHRSPARPPAAVQFAPSHGERQTPVLSMPPLPSARPPAPVTPPSARVDVWSNLSAQTQAPTSVPTGHRPVLPPAFETPRRTLDSAAALFAHTPAVAASVQASATPWSMEPRQAPAPNRPASALNYDEMDAAADLSADLLRPLLRQWLDENMSCMVARALQSESMSSGALAKKTD